MVMMAGGGGRRCRRLSWGTGISTRSVQGDSLSVVNKVQIPLTDSFITVPPKSLNGLELYLVHSFLPGATRLGRILNNAAGFVVLISKNVFIKFY